MDLRKVTLDPTARPTNIGGPCTAYVVMVSVAGLSRPFAAVTTIGTLLSIDLACVDARPSTV